MNTTQVTAEAGKVSTKETAAATYERRQVAIECELDSIADALTRHAMRAGADARNWGYAGDLAAVLCLLEQATAMLGGAK